MVKQRSFQKRNGLNAFGPNTPKENIKIRKIANAFLWKKKLYMNSKCSKFDRVGTTIAFAIVQMTCFRPNNKQTISIQASNRHRK